MLINFTCKNFLHLNWFVNKQLLPFKNEIDRNGRKGGIRNNIYWPQEQYKEPRSTIRRFWWHPKFGT